MPSAGAVAVVLLAVSLVVMAFILTQMGGERRLRARIVGVSGDEKATEDARDAAALAARSIRIARGAQGAWLRGLFRFMNYNPEVREAYTFPRPLLFIIGAAIALGVFFRFSVFMGPYWAAFAGFVVGVLFIRMVFGSQFNKYRDALFQQIPDSMGLVVRAIRAGLPMSEALRSISREMPSPTKDEYARIVGDVAIGRPVDEAIMRLYERTKLTELAFLAVTLGLQSQTGGSLAETLDNLADMVRKRVMAAKRAKALAAEGRMQAGILVVLPFIAALAMSFIQPGYVETYTSNPTGIRMALIGFGMMVLGILVIRWMIIQAGKD